MSLLKKLSNKKEIINESLMKRGLMGALSEKRLRQLQLCELEMYFDICRTCKKNGISVYLVAGSALGAVRHGGFIPWDDDLDIAMSRADYNVFQSLFQNEFSERYILNAPNYSRGSLARFPKILLRDSYLQTIDEDVPTELQKVFIDIFIIENTPDRHFTRAVKGFVCNLLEWIAGQVQSYKSKDETMRTCLRSGGRLYYFTVMATGFLFSFMDVSRWNDLIDLWVRCNNEESRYCSLPTSRKHYFGEMLERKKVFPGTLVTFEGQKALVFQEVDSYLSGLYGDYAQIPPPEKRECHGFSMLRLPTDNSTQNRC